MEKALLNEMIRSINRGGIFEFIEENTNQFSRSDLEKMLLEFSYACTDSDGYVFDATRQSLIDYLKDSLSSNEKSKPENDSVAISPKEYIEQGGMTTSDKEVKQKDDREKD